MAASSSSAAAAPFPTALEGETLLFRWRSQAYRALVRAVHHVHGVNLAIVLLKVTEKTPKRGFSAGEDVMLETADGGRWSGVIASPDEGDALVDSLYTWVHVHVPYQGDLSLLGIDSFLNMYPFHHEDQADNSLTVPSNWWEVEVSRDQNNQLTDTEAKAKPKPKPKVFDLKVGVIGFGAIGRQVAEIVADTEDIELIAIVDDLTVHDMIMAWKSSKFSIRNCGEKALWFKRKIPELGKNDDFKVAVLNGREHDKCPWGKLRVGHVIDTLHIFSEDNKQIVYAAHGNNDSQNQLMEDDHPVYTMVYAHKRVTNCFNLPIKYMKILIIAEEAKKVMAENFPESRGGCVNLCFLAETDPTTRICDPLAELYLCGKDEDEEKAKEKEVGDRLISILSCCVRIIRRAAIGGIFLMI